MAPLSARNWVRRCLLVAFSTAAMAGQAAAQSPKPRKWKDASGQFEIEATFVSEKDGVITLKQTSGEEVEIELKQLSPADEAYVRVEMAKANSPFKKKSDSSPFQPKSGSMPADSGADPVGSTAAPNAMAIDWNSASLLSPPAEPNWSAIKIEPVVARKAKSSQLPPKRDVFEKFGGLAAGDGFAILAYKQPDTFRKGNPETTRLLKVDLESGKVQGTILVDGIFDVLDVSPSGDQLLMLKDVPAGQDPITLEIWRPTGKSVQREKAFNPFVNEDRHNQKVEGARLAANGKVVATARFGRAGVFDPATGEAIATIPKAHAIALSPDRKYAAILGEALMIVDLDSGEAVASLPTDKTHGSTVGFSPDGKRIAVARGNQMTVWNLSDGEIYRDETFAAMAAFTGSPLLFTTPDHVLVNGVLVDLENHIPLWSFNGSEAAATTGGATLLLPHQGTRASGLIATELPHAEARNALKAALASPNLFAVRPGTAISVDVSGIPDAGEQQNAKAGLEAALTAAGMKPTPGAPAVLKASMASENEEREFRTFGAGFNTTTINTTKYTAKVELTVGGQTAWQSSSVSGAAHFVTSKQGESLQDAVNRSNKPNYGFFKAVSIPQYIMQPGKTTLGSTAINTGF